MTIRGGKNDQQAWETKTGSASVGLRYGLQLSTALALVLALGATAEPARAQSVTAEGNVSPFPSQNPQPNWVVGGTLYVGNTSSGTLTIADGGWVENTDGYIAYGVQHSSVTVSGTDTTGRASTWKNSGDLYIRRGELTIADGGRVENRDGYIGYAARGSATVSGNASTWHNSGDLYVSAAIGGVSKGTLIIADGGRVENLTGYIGVLGLAGSSVTVSGTDSEGNASTWDNSGNLYVGLDTSATLLIEDGGRVENTNGYIGTGNGNSSVTVSGTDTAGNASTWDNSDTLVVGNSGSGTLTIANGGRVLAGDGAGGPGTIHLGSAGSGTLNIGTATGPADAKAGTLAAAQVEFNGNSTLNFNHVGETVFSAALVSDGTGTHTVNHLAGTTTLTGDSSRFTGTTTVSGGTLLVGNAQGNGLLGGNVDVFDSAILGGSGTVGSGTGSLVKIASGGTLAPGNSIGTLTVDGDLAFETGARFAVEVNPVGSESDLVTVTGTATLNGGSVAHIGASGNYDIRSTYTILSAGTLTGAFEDVTSDFAFLSPDLVYDYGHGTVDLRLTRNDIDFAADALTRNQIATANGIESIGIDAGHAVYDAIAQLTDDADLIRASFDALSGEVHASAKTALIQDSRFVRNAANDRIRAAFDNAGASYVPVLAYGPGDDPVLVSADHAGPVFWSQGFGSWGSTDSDGNAAALDRSTGGLLIGTDGLVGDWRIGLLAGYSHSSFDMKDRASSGKSDSYHLGLYGGTQWGNVAFRTGAAYSWHDIDTSRAVAIPGIGETLSAGYSAGTFQAFGEFGYGIDTGTGSRFEPFINLAHVSLHSNGFTEQGGAAALAATSSTTNVTFATLGLRGEHNLALGAVDATLHGMIGWRHAFGDITPQSTHTFSAGNAFTIAGVPIARNSAVIEAGLDLNLTPEATFGLSYTGQLAADAYDQGFKANLNVRF